MTATRHSPLKKDGTPFLGPKAKMQPKQKPGCVSCGRLPDGPDDLGGTTRSLHEAGWRIRDAGTALFLVCPDHAGQGDW